MVSRPFHSKINLMENSDPEIDGNGKVLSKSSKVE